MPSSRNVFADICLENGVNLHKDTVIFDISAVVEQEMNPEGGLMFADAKGLPTNGARCNPLFPQSFYQWQMPSVSEALEEKDYKQLQRLNPHYKLIDDYGLYMIDIRTLGQQSIIEGCYKRLNLAPDAPYRVYLSSMYARFCQTYFEYNRMGALLVFDLNGVWQQDLSGGFELVGAGADMPIYVAYGLTLYSLSLMHNKAPLEFVDYPRNYRRKVERETGKEPSPYFWLDFNPDKPRKKYKNSVQSPSEAGKQNRALHVVRGYWLHQPETHKLPQFRGKTFWVEGGFTRGGNKDEKGKTDMHVHGYRIRLRKGQSHDN